ncbi:NAD(+)/NADH kinase [Bulleidia sp. zg-1006]|uniref:NAD(+)/NADH kinase n=1 Tax=Bulleidia sp. zg-1006 TaxID=2806552 RepID=UPI00193A176A|nr:NAD(+)/NADH kinase [Bulleidia sp. zg-1006]QRG86778.1 NAD(+)/NADH kinase [Bulleidia sp. zg-1006]
MKKMNKFVCIVRPDGVSMQLKEDIQNHMLKKGWQEDLIQPELVFVIGGDGAFIHAAHEYVDVQPLYYPIQTGTLGFFAQYNREDFYAYLEALEGDYYEQILPLLETKINDEVIYGVNEIRIENVMHTQITDVLVNGHFFENLRSSGVCISTQVGSTAYNRSLGGAVIANGVEAMQMVEIAGIHNQKYQSLNVPIVFPWNTVLRFQSKDFEDAVLGADSKVVSLKGIHDIEVRYSKEKKVRVLRTNWLNPLDNLQSLF